MKMHLPTHEEIARLAWEIWQAQGNPPGRDHEIWLEAEQELSRPLTARHVPSTPGGRGNDNSQASRTPANPKTDEPKQPLAPSPDKNTLSTATESRRLKGEMASESAVEFNISPAIPEEEAIQAALQTREARAPQFARKSAPQAKPVESGKPLWHKPHSS